MIDKGIVLGLATTGVVVAGAVGGYYAYQNYTPSDVTTMQSDKTTPSAFEATPSANITEQDDIYSSSNTSSKRRVYDK